MVPLVVPTEVGDIPFFCAREIILFLVSRDFIASDYIHYTEIKTVIENQKLVLIPVIIRPVELSQLEFSIYQVVPSEAKPIVNWENKDEAWLDVVSSLKLVFDRINRVNPVQEQDNNNVIPGKAKSNTLKHVNLSDKLVLIFTILLMCIGLFLLIYGIIKHENGAGDDSLFYIYISFAVVGIGLFGYFFGRTSLTF